MSSRAALEFDANQLQLMYVRLVHESKRTNRDKDAEANKGHKQKMMTNNKQHNKAA